MAAVSLSKCSVLKQQRYLFAKWRDAKKDKRLSKLAPQTAARNTRLNIDEAVLRDLSILVTRELS